MPLTDQEIKMLADRANYGRMLSLSPTKSVSAMGQGLTQPYRDNIKEKMKFRSPINLGRGILIDPTTGEATSNEAYGESLQSERDYNKAFQKQKDDAALERARISGLRTLNAMPGAEKKLYRLSGVAADQLPAIADLVDKSPDAFGHFTNVESYLPDGTPNWVNELAKTENKKRFSNDQQAAQNAVFQQAYQIINDLAGAALSQHEKSRIEAFTPAPNDDARTIVNKLRSAYQAASRMRNSFADSYGGIEPYNQVEIPEMLDVNAAPAAVPATPQAGKQPVGEPFNLQDGTVWQEYSDGTTLQVQ